jgi:hypothetical protein
MSSPSIERCPHNKEHPFIMLSRALVRDKTISPNCRMMLIHILTNIDSWKICIKQLINEFKGWDGWGRDNIYKYLKEAIEAGYIKSENYIDKGLKRVRYFISEEPKFKKLTESAIQEPADTDCKEERYPKGYLKNDKKDDIETPSKCASADTAFFDPQKIEFPDGSRLSKRTLCAIKKYSLESLEKLKRAYEYLCALYEDGKRPKTSYERWLQDCFNKDYAKENTNIFHNTLYAKYIKESLRLGDYEFKIMKTVVKLKNDSISLRLPVDTFSQAINNYITQWKHNE